MRVPKVACSGPSSTLFQSKCRAPRLLSRDQHFRLRALVEVTVAKNPASLSEDAEPEITLQQDVPITVPKPPLSPTVETERSEPTPTSSADNHNGSHNGADRKVLEEPAAAAQQQASKEPLEAAAISKPQPFTLIEKRSLAGGVLELVAWEGERLLRIWCPPGYSPTEAGHAGYPVLYLNDGQNLYDDSLSFSGRSWGAGQTAAALITSGQLPPFVIVGIDHSGATRSLDYCPYKPGTGPGQFRKDAEKWPGGGVKQYMERVVKEVMPFVNKHYHVSQDPRYVGFGGSSFGGICTLCFGMAYPELFSALLVESPSLWINDEKFLKEDISSYKGKWPQRVFIGMGGEEYTGIRKAVKGDEQWDELVKSYAFSLANELKDQGLDDSRVKVVVEDKATHTEAAWAKRLPDALKFLLAPWWDMYMERHKDSLYFTIPKTLKAGQPGVLFVNKSRSDALKDSPASPTAVLAYNGWRLGSTKVPMTPAPLLPPGWHMAPITVPNDAYEMNLVLTDGASLWDNNNGEDFYLSVKNSRLSLVGQSAEALLEHAREALARPVDDLAAGAGHSLFFTCPEVLVSGAPAVMYMNRRASDGLRDSPNVKVHLGFNNWELPAQMTLDLKPTSLWRGENIDWWSSHPFDVPTEAYEMNFAFTDGHDRWDNNWGHNYATHVEQLRLHHHQAPRGIQKVESFEHGAGTLHIVTLTKRAITDQASKRSRWQEEKVLRVWTPPGFNKEKPPPGGYPVLYFNDGQNLFEDWLAHQGHAWKLGYTASDLITSGRVPPFICVGIDSAGPMRSLNYLPYPPGTGQGGFRGDCERWPGGGVEQYMHRVVGEIMPLVQEHFAAASEPDRVAFGGGSFAGVCALYAAMKFPHVFGAVLAESPSLWVAEGRFLRDMEGCSGRLPERIFMGCGTREYSATRDHDRDDVDALLSHYYHEAARILREKGMKGNRMMFQVEEGAGHHELAWQWRLTGALEFLLAPWWN